jgi:hypothetical protein
VAGTVFGFNGGFWNTAVNVHVWPLSILMLCAVLCLLLRWSYEPERKRHLYLAFFLYGLTLTNSQIMFTAAPALPFLFLAGSPHVARDGFLAGSLLCVAGLVAKYAGYFPMIEGDGDSIHPLFRLYLIIGAVTSGMAIGLIIKTRRLLTEWRTMLVCGAFLLLGLALYLYLPLASMTNPPINWGYSRTATGFFHVLSRGQFERIYPTDTLARYAGQMRMFAEIAWKELGGAPLLLAMVPVFFLRRMQWRERAWTLGLLALFVCLSFLMVALLNPSDWRGSREIQSLFFSASYIVLALCLGCGLTLLGVLLGKPSGSAAAAVNS